jgi:acyl-CoA oxidase
LVDSGYCFFHNVRIPRTNLLSKYQHVEKDGTYVKHSSKKSETKSATESKQVEAASNRLQYIVMISTRVGMVYGAYSALAKAATIAIRYSAVRHQGFKDTRGEGDSGIKSGENAVLDYQVQQYRLFKALSQSFAFFFAALNLRAKMLSFTKGLASGDVSELPELHATSAGLKAFCTNWAGDGVEECRRCCGGHGVTMSSGIAKLLVDYISIAPIAEGDKIVLALQTARFLVRSVEAIRKKQPVSGVVKYLEGEERKPDFSRLRDLSSLVDAFRWRARQSAFYATEQFERSLSSGVVFDVAWNKNAVELVQAAEHHCSYVLVLTFATEVEKLKDPDIKRVLHQLALHFALVQVKERAGDWTPHISAKQVQEVKHTVNQLLAEIRPESVALVDSFGFSDNSLQSAIGRYDGNVYEALLDYARKSPLNEEAYIQEFWNEHLKDVLDRDYLKKNKSTQRVSKL